ncbi:hypothetical protein [Tabrizicola aquatica]|uniref:hypothetical protein n=1 Tax=Tabrizicola aquatica TaxID=909926 RepID=UPI000CD0D87A|nr:hypothetical protein [Tabrizicola aquatica]
MTCASALFQHVGLLAGSGLAIVVGPWLLVKLAASGGWRFVLALVLGWGLASGVVVLAVLGVLAARSARSGTPECAWSDLIASLWYMSVAGLFISVLLTMVIRRRARRKSE